MKFLGFGESCEEFFDFFGWVEFVLIGVKDDLGLGTGWEDESVVVFGAVCEVVEGHHKLLLFSGVSCAWRKIAEDRINSCFIGF